MIDWLLVDYGEVLSTAPPEATFTELAAIADALSIMDAAPEQVLFIDDRAENTAAAADLGMPTITFTSVGALARQLAHVFGQRPSDPR